VRTAIKALVCHATLSIIFVTSSALSTAATPDDLIERVKVTRLLDRAIIGPELDPSIGTNIQGPSLIRVPEWVEGRLGNYYLYFADHKGSYIRLAYADDLLGPWRIHVPGTVQIGESYFLTEPPALTDEEVEAMVVSRQAGWSAISHDWRTEFTSPHIASPDVHIDQQNRRIIMYFHGLNGPGAQLTRAAISDDGIHFEVFPENLGRTYLRAFEHEGITYAMAMPGQFYRSVDGLTSFEEGPRLFNPAMRHAALMKRDNWLYVFWTQVGDAPEHIKLSLIDISGDWQDWQESTWREVLRPEFDWEGAGTPIEPSVRSTAYGMVNQLRDPALFKEDGRIYLLYTVGGESGIAIAEVEL